MSKYFVTGANGFIGSRLIEALVARGHEVRALSRRPELKPQPPPGFDWPGGGPLASPLVEWVRGDITDRDSLLRAMDGATHVFHLAAYAKNWAPDPGVFWTMNVLGARNVFDAAAQLEIERVVWTSTMLTFGPTRPGQVGNEDSPRMTSGFFTEYDETKALAEQEAIGRALGGFPLVIVNPARVYGPGYLTEGNSVTQLIDQYDRGKMPFLLNFGVNVANWVCVDDVVQGLLLAMEKGRVGERYILGGENASLRQFFRLIDRVSGKRHLQIPVWRFWPLVIARIQKRRADRRGIYPRITPGWVRLFCADWAYSSQKAEQELGYRPTPLAEGLRRTYQWLQRVRNEQR
jgi:farnesol dehydrogenase